MPHLITVLAIFLLFYFLVGRNFFKLWKVGLIGVGIMMVADYAGFRLNLWHYQNGLFTIGNFMPVFHIVNIYLVSIIFINRLPSHWGKRALYIVYFSVLSLAVEAWMFRNGGIIYPNWKMWYSYFLILGGLSLLAYLSDFMHKERLHGV